MPDQEKQNTSEEKGEVTSEMSVTLPTQIPGGERTEGIKKQITEVARELVEQNHSPEELQDFVGPDKNNPNEARVQQPAAQADYTRPAFDSRKEKSDPLIGQIIDKKYEILEVLGEGGMGRVYKVKHVLTGKIQALKILRAHLASKATSVRRFQREAKAASRIEHPNCVAVTDFGEWEDMFYMVMEYVSGPNLSRIIRENGRRNSLPLKRALPIFVQICAGLEGAHRHGIVHRDVKSSNVVLVSKDGTSDFVKVLDFGIAKLGPNEGEATLTESGEVFGSPYYMSPEQCLGKDLDTRSDIYSLGCLMYEALSGRVPFEGENVIATITKQISEPPERIIFDADVEKVIGDQLNDLIVSKVLAKDPKDRPQTMAVLQYNLLTIQNALDNPTLAKKLLKPTRSTQEFRLRGSKPPLYTVVFILCIAVGVGYLVKLRDVSRQEAALKAFAETTARIDRTLEWIEPRVSSYATDHDAFLRKERALLDEQSRLRLMGGMGTKLEVRSLVKLGSFYLAAGQYEQARNQLQRAFALATELKLDKSVDDASDMAEAAYGLALYWLREKSYGKCALYVRKCLELTNDRQIKGQGLVIGRAILGYELLGQCHSHMSDQQKLALLGYSEVYRLATENRYYQSASEEVLLAVARTSDYFIKVGDFQKAADLLDWLVAAWQRYLVKGNVSLNEYIALNNYGFINLKQQRWRSALNAFQSAREDLAQFDTTSGKPKELMFKILLNEADCYSKLNEPNKANDCLRQAQKLSTAS